jgi:hypothetical protein
VGLDVPLPPTNPRPAQEIIMQTATTRAVTTRQFTAAEHDALWAPYTVALDAVLAQPSPARFLADKLREARPDRVAALDALDALINAPTREEAQRLNRQGWEMEDNHGRALGLLASSVGGLSDKPREVMRRAGAYLILYHIHLVRIEAVSDCTSTDLTAEMIAQAAAKVAPPSRGQRP